MSGNLALLDGQEPIRVGLLWKQMSGHTAAGVRALLGLGAGVFVASRSPRQEAPFDESRWGFPCFTYEDTPDIEDLERALVVFDPHVLLVASWNLPAYRRISAQNSVGALRVLCMDNQWIGSMRQWIGRITAPWYLRPAFDVAWVPGDGAFSFARRLGYRADRIWWGQYAADVEAFGAVSGRLDHDDPLPRAFLFAGRLVEEKGVDVLADAYAEYRRGEHDPWPMIVAGKGPWRDQLSSVDGIELVGFVQPDELAQLMRRASCLVLPSRFEPWGVVVQEACAAGLAVIASRACGATSRLVLPDFNGSIVEPGDHPSLVNALHRYANLPDAERRKMGRAATVLSKQFTPQRWAETVLRGVHTHLGQVPAA